MKYTNYDEDDLQACVDEMSSTFNSLVDQQAVLRKYSSSKFGSVSKLNLIFNWSSPSPHYAFLSELYPNTFTQLSFVLQHKYSTNRKQFPLSYPPQPTPSHAIYYISLSQELSSYMQQAWRKNRHIRHQFLLDMCIAIDVSLYLTFSPNFNL